MSESTGLGIQFRDLKQQKEAYRLGAWIFVASEVMLFSGLFLVYLVARTTHPEAFHDGSQELDVVLGSLNTGVLLTSSLTMAMAVHRAEHQDYKASSWWLIGTAILGALFVFIKVYEWSEELHKGLVPGFVFTYDGPHPQGVQLFLWFYFTSTALHALHLSVGILATLWFAFVTRFRAHWIPDPSPVVLAGIYWHLVDVVWIFLYPLLYLVGGPG